MRTAALAAGASAWGPESGVGSGLRLPGRILLCSVVLPPHASGHSAAIDRLLAPVDPRDYRLICFDVIGEGAFGARGALPLPGRAFRHAQPWLPARPDIGVRNSARYAAAVGREAVRRARIMAETIRDEGCEVLVATSGTPPLLPSAALAAWMAGVPLVVLMWDYWRLQSNRFFQRRFAELAEPRVLQQAAAVGVGNELLADAIRRHDGVEPVLMRIPTDEAAFEGHRLPRRREPGAPFRIVYTGAVYDAMQDSIARVAALMDAPEFGDVEFHLYGGQSREDLAAAGIHGRIHVHGWVNPPEIYRIHREADALLLPLAFSGELRDIIRTSNTTKLGDYLASGRPILVNAPRESFVNWFARRHGCGLPVESDRPEALGRAIHALKQDPALGDRIGQRGLEAAQREFDPASSRRQFVAMIDVALSDRRGRGRG